MMPSKEPLTPALTSLNAFEMPCMCLIALESRTILSPMATKQSTQHHVLGP